MENCIRHLMDHAHQVYNLSDHAARLGRIPKLDYSADAIEPKAEQGRALLVMPSNRATDLTMRMFSSAEYCLRVARRMSLTTFSTGSFAELDCCLIFVPLNVTMSQKLSLLQSAQSVS
jgi:hypothetical protein